MTTLKALASVRVLDFSKVLAGPLCAQYLGDMGADVVKIEPLNEGDDTRRYPPFLDSGTHHDGTIFLSVNRNKRSFALDLKTDAGRDICHKLVMGADVVIESFGPGVAERLGIDHATLMALNPRLVHCSISGYGSVGPMKEGKGYDAVLQAFSGMLSISGERGGKHARSPFSPVDQGTGLHALIGILAALFERTATGKGMRVEASLFDTSIGFLGYILQGFWANGREPEPPGSSHDSLCPYEVFSTGDKPMLLGVANDSLWRKFCAVAGAPEVAADPRFTTNALRVANRRETVATVTALLATRGRDDWVKSLGLAGIPCSPVQSLGEMAAHPHTTEGGMLQKYVHPIYGELKTVSQPIKLQGERNSVMREAPLLGQHTAQILYESGYSSQEIDELAASGVINASAKAVAS
ncbi:MAG: coA-transferase family protein [Polaromonas sp.]|nr:coA-transferase family protein [Polaromonas sp.]